MTSAAASPRRRLTLDDWALLDEDEPGEIVDGLGFEEETPSLVHESAFGVRRYWIVDPAERTFELLELGQDGRYARVLGAAEGRFSPPGCDGLVLNLDELWAEIDRLE